jgi:hypothetical protein
MINFVFSQKIKKGMVPLGNHPLKYNGGTDDAFVAKIQNGVNLTIGAGTGGTTNPAPGVTKYDENSVVTVQAIPSGGYRFDRWTGDVPAGSATNNPLLLTMDSNKSITPVFVRQYTLTIIAGIGGTTTPVTGTYTYDEGTSVSVQAVAAAAYEFNTWTGDVSGLAKPVTVAMNANKSIQANFTRAVKQPLNLTGERVANRTLFRIEYAIRLKWQPNPANTGTIGYRIYQIENGQATSVAEVAAGMYEYNVRRLQQTKTYRFGVTAVNNQGWESEMVDVTVQ